MSAQLSKLLPTTKDIVEALVREGVEAAKLIAWKVEPARSMLGTWIAEAVRATWAGLEVERSNSGLKITNVDDIIADAAFTTGVMERLGVDAEMVIESLEEAFSEAVMGGLGGLYTVEANYMVGGQPPGQASVESVFVNPQATGIADAVAGLYWVNAVHQRFVERYLSKREGLLDIIGAVDAVEALLYPEIALLRVRGVEMGAEQIIRDLLDALNALYTRMIDVENEYLAIKVAYELGKQPKSAVQLYEYKVRVYARATLDELKRLYNEIVSLPDLLLSLVDVTGWGGYATALDKLIGGLGKELADEIGEWLFYLMAGRIVKPAAIVRIKYIDPVEGIETQKDVSLEEQP